MKKVYNQNKTEILTNYDLSKGRLVNDTLEINHAAVEGQDRKGHYETVREYANGGKDIVFVEDQAAIEARPAYTEKLDILVYVPYSETELKRNEITHNIRVLKNNLTKTDYKLFKYVEGELTAEEYAPIKEQRKQWRAQINALEIELQKTVDNAN